MQIPLLPSYFQVIKANKKKKKKKKKKRHFDAANYALQNCLLKPKDFNYCSKLIHYNQRNERLITTDKVLYNLWALPHHESNLSFHQEHTPDVLATRPCGRKLGFEPAYSVVSGVVLQVSENMKRNAVYSSYLIKESLAPTAVGCKRLVFDNVLVGNSVGQPTMN
uniref:Uncharacterized protein n=1 Tax=Glossina austeni TaxID=7395 RepID=A0A1A9UU40_GLOAU